MSFPTVQNLLRDLEVDNLTANNMTIIEDGIIGDDLTIGGDVIGNNIAFDIVTADCYTLNPKVSNPDISTTIWCENSGNTLQYGANKVVLSNAGVLDPQTISISTLTSANPVLNIDKFILLTGNTSGYSIDFANDMSSTNGDIRLTNGSLFMDNGTISISNNGTNDLPTLATKNLNSNDPEKIINCNSGLNLSNLATIGGVGRGTIQLEAILAGPYGIPTSSALIYCDSDNVLKVKNVNNNIVALSNVPTIGNLSTESNVTGTTITTDGTYTIITQGGTVFTLNNNSSDLSSPVNGFIRFDGASNMRVLLTWSANVNFAVAVDHDILIAPIINAVVDGSGQWSAGTLLQKASASIHIPTSTSANASGSAVITMQNLDTIAMFVSVTSSTDSPTFTECSLSLTMLSAGLD